MEGFLTKLGCMSRAGEAISALARRRRGKIEHKVDVHHGLENAPTTLGSSKALTMAHLLRVAE